MTYDKNERLSFRLESIEANSADVYQGNYNIVVWWNEFGVGCTDDFSLVINADIENDVDYESISIHDVSVVSMEIYDDNDNRYDAPLLTFNAVKDRVEAFIENNDEVLEYIEDLIEGLAEESRVERLLSNKEAKEWEEERFAMGE